MLSNGQPYMRNKHSYSLKREANIAADIIGDRIGHNESPSQMAMTTYQNQRTSLRAEGERKSAVNQMLFTGTGSFSMQKKLADQSAA